MVKFVLPGTTAAQYCTDRNSRCPQVVFVQILKKTGFADGLFEPRELDKKWEGYEKDKVVSRCAVLTRWL
jgi:hypothetical protein